MREGLSRPLGLALVIGAFCLPLFTGLHRTDVESDEAIYSYAVDQILVNGDWLNPRSSPHDDAVFLEKPPLKFWIVAAPIRFGLLPHDEFGLRFWDAFFGAAAFLYVFAFGARLSGPVCGVIAVMVLFVHGPLLFEHGIRGNNMESPLFLSYCGGLYHFIAWGAAATAGRRRWHVLAAAGYFWLGFMTKFVAAFFLPMVVAASLLILPSARRRLAQEWRTWALAAGLFVAAAAPWFVYEHVREGTVFWQIIFGTHVFARFTAYLDPSHLHPWNFYYVTIWRDLQHVGVGWLAVVGGLLAAVSLARERRLETVTLAGWLIIPLALMSIGTSKLPHYAYPFVPAFALLVGFGPGWLIRAGRAHVVAAMERLDQLFDSGRRWGAVAKGGLLALALVALSIAATTLVFGPISWRIGGVQVMRNAHVMRPLLVALGLATLAGRGVAASRVIFPVVVLLAVLPVNAYEDALRRLRVENHPLRSAGACLVGVRAAELAAGRPAAGIYAIGEQRWFLHNYFYYLSRAGGWDRAETLEPAALESALFVPGRQRPVMIGDTEYRAFKTDHPDALRAVPALPLREVLLLLPGPYASCGPVATARTRS